MPFILFLLYGEDRTMYGAVPTTRKILGAVYMLYPHRSSLPQGHPTRVGQRDGGRRVHVLQGAAAVHRTGPL